ncbi:protein kinase domain-containing protein [Streptomyces daliensis]|uniref:Protein kinase n=1 Tax=Streptomyces daliensis TaxID=299421 RepID=A0A8T4J0P6_9ACTN|nr:protein kinase [Streptomyces daliensis]
MIHGFARLGGTDPRQLGPYRLHGVLGTGSTGTVYLGRGAPRRGERKQLAAVRAVRPELLRDRQLRARLRHEMQTAASLRSRYVAAALGCELDSEHPWMATEFVPGPPLSAAVARYGPLPEHAVRALGAALAQGLADLHAVRVAHRDPRPCNVLLAADAPRLVDYSLGLGRTDLGHDDDHAEGGAARAADDIFELGSTLVVAAGAHQPFAGSMLPSAREDPDLTGVPDGLCPALLACLHKTPESRPLPVPLARALDLEGAAERPAAEWLPEAYVHEIDEVEDAAKSLAGRRLFGR